jgi:hypothetical protein
MLRYIILRYIMYNIKILYIYMYNIQMTNLMQYYLGVSEHE